MVCQLWLGCFLGDAGETSDADHDVSDSEPEEKFQQRSERHQWHLCGVPVCFSNFCHLLQTSSVTVRKQLAGIPDGRHHPKVDRGPSEKARCVDFFFYELYHSAAEPLPCLPRQNHQAKKTVALEDADIWFDGQPWLSMGDSLADVNEVEAEGEDWNPDAPSVSSLTAFTVAASAVVVGLPKRYIQHIRVHDLYWLFQASWDVICVRSPDVPDVFEQGKRCPSYSLFLSRWQVWKKYIRVRDPNQMAQCQTCWELQQTMNKPNLSWDKRAQAAKDLRQHHSDQYLDRTIYWSMRWASRSLGSVLCIIIDSMDKSKMCWPRWPFDRKPKSLEGIFRPKFVFTLAMAHGWCTCAFVQD